jgi:hypothetical protein
MGHERLGVLPKTKKWRAIVSEIAAQEPGDNTVATISENTLAALGSRYRDLSNDPAVQSAFNYLVELARSAASPDAQIANRSPLALVSELAQRLRNIEGSLETRELAQRAAADAIATWHRENVANETDLFQESAPPNRWDGLGSGAGFCELSRFFFASLTERYLNYFLEREASAVISDFDSREKFRQRLGAHVSELSMHAFESSKITQSYAAGWFNKHALTARPSNKRVEGFLSYAFEKLREEFRREGGK